MSTIRQNTTDSSIIIRTGKNVIIIKHLQNITINEPKTQFRTGDFGTMNTEMDIRQIALILWRKLWVILLFMLLCGGLAFSISNWMITPLYSASVSMYVYNSNRADSNISSSDLATSQKLVDTYIVILKSNTVLNQVSRELGEEYSSDAIRNMLSASSINNTEAFSVTIKHPDPWAAERIVNTIARVSPLEITRVVKAGSVEVIDYATTPQYPSHPNIYRNTAVGALAGTAAAILLLILLTMLDTVVRSEEDLTVAFDIPILGVIPKLPENGKGVR